MALKSMLAVGGVTVWCLAISGCQSSASGSPGPDATASVTSSAPSPPPATSDCLREPKALKVDANREWSVPVTVPAWLDAQGVYPGDVDALEIPRSWITGQPKPDDPKCQAVQVGEPARAGLLCATPLGADNDPRFPNDKRWELWRADQGRLTQVWVGRQTLDGLRLELKWESPGRFRVSGSPATTCAQVARLMLKNYSQYHTPAQRIVPSQILNSSRAFCAQHGVHEWNGKGFERNAER